jgi:putative redox protein
VIDGWAFRAIRTASHAGCSAGQKVLQRLLFLQETDMTIEVRAASPEGGLRYTVTAEGHPLPLAFSQPEGEGPDPHDYFDSALGGCKALTLMWYARRKQLPLTSVDVDVLRDASEEKRGVYRLTARLTLHGDLTEAQRAELLDVAGKCPIHRLMTTADVQVTTELA